MTLFHWIAQLWHRDPQPSQQIAQAAAEATSLALAQLAPHVHQMPAAERYGYVRAHATGPVRRTAQRYLVNHPKLAQLSAPSFEHAVLDAVVDQTLAKIARPRPVAALRRAA